MTDQQCQRVTIAEEFVVPVDHAVDFVHDLMNAMAAVGRHHGVTIIGGETVFHPMSETQPDHTP